MSRHDLSDVPLLSMDAFKAEVQAIIKAGRASTAHLVMHPFRIMMMQAEDGRKESPKMFLGLRLLPDSKMPLTEVAIRDPDDPRQDRIPGPPEEE